MATDYPSYGRLALDRYGEEPESALIRTQMESGPPKQAMVRSKAMVGRPVTYVYSDAEYASWKTWFRDTIARGADWFNWTDPQDGITKLARIEGGIYTAKPFSPYPGAPLSWEVSFRLETWD